MEQIVITRSNGSQAPLVCKSSATAIKSAKQTWELLGNDVVNINVESPHPQTYYIGDRITVFGRVYKLNRLPKVTKTGAHAFSYDLEFEGVQYDLMRATYDLTIDTTNNELQDVQANSLTGDLRRFATVLISNADRVFPGVWALGTCPDTVGDKTLTFGEDDNCLSVLQNLCSEFDVEFEIEQIGGSGVFVINFVNKIGQIFPYTFEFGKGKGLYHLDRQNVDSSNIVTRLKVFGSTSNITHKYRANRLCLPGKTKGQSYIEKLAAVEKYGIWEATKYFDDIKPTFNGSITSLVPGSVLKFADSKMFDLNESDANGTKYLLNGVAAKIHFNSGNLAGYEFELKKNGGYNHATKIFSLLQITDDRGDKFPSDISPAFQFGTGDEYKILDVALPEQYEQAAEEKLAVDGNTYYDQNSQPKVQYGLSVTKNYLEKKLGSEGTVVNIFAPGDYIPVKDDDIGVDKSVRIKSLTRNLLDEYDYSLTISDTVTSNITNHVLSELIELDKIVTINKLKDPARAVANWRSSRELLNMVFDPDGDYFTEKIKPGSIDTQLLSVGAKSMQFGLTNTVFAPNYNSDKNVIKVTGGVLAHYTIDENARLWNLADNITTFASDSAAYYIYARCMRTGTAGSIIFSEQQIKVEDDVNFYHFWIGVVNSVDSTLQTRSLALSYGFSMINGRYITTGRIQSADGRTWFDLDTGEISGAIKFLSSGGGYRDVEDVEATANSASTIATQASVAAHAAQNAVDNIEIGGRNYLLDSRYNDLSKFFATEGYTASLVQDAYMGNVLEISLLSGTPKNFQTLHTYVNDGILNQNVVYFLIAKDMGGNGGFSFGGWSETYTKLTHNSNKIDKGNGWYMYWATFKSGDTLGGSFGTNNISGCWRIYSAGILRGNKPTDWTPAPEDVQAAVTAAQTIAQAAQLTANTEKLRLDEWASDGFISPTEKTGLKQQQSDIQSEYNEIDGQATLYGLKSSAEWTQYNSAYSSANAAFNKYTATTPETITITSDYANIAAYYPKRQAILDLIAVKANNFASKRDNNLLKPENLRISQGTSIAPEDYSGFCNQLCGSTSENLIVSGEGPFGSTVKLWKCISDGGNDADGGWDKAGNFVADLNETYRFCVFVKREAVLGRAYWGVNSDGAIKDIGGAVNFNPYFAYPYLQGKWMLLVGHVYPINSSVPASTTSGVYDVETGKKIVGEWSQDYAFSGLSNIIYCRAYQYNSSQAGCVQYFSAPMVHKCDGTEPSIATILGLDAKAQAQLSDIAADNKLTPSEKRIVQLEWENIQKECSVIESEAYLYSEVMPTVLFEARRAGQTGTPDIFVVPETGRYKITAMGAAGSASDSRNRPANAGYTGGKGAEVSAEFDLQAGDVLTFVVGKMGTRIDAPTAPTDGVGGMGGGGTFVFKNIAAITDSRYQFTKNGQAFEVLLVAAGGGGTTDLNYSTTPQNGADGIGATQCYRPDFYTSPNTTTFSGSTSSSQPYGGSIQQYISNNAIGGYYTRGGNEGRGGYGGGAIADDDRSSGGGWYSDGVQAYSWSAGLYTEGKTGVNAGNGRVTAGLRKDNINSGDYLASYSDLMLYLTPLLSDLETTSDIDGLTFRMKFLSYYSSRQALLNAIENERGGRISDAQIAALSANSLAMSQAYIEEALRNDTTINGGLLSTTLIKVGSTSDGEWIEKAGINGADIGDSVVRFYAGGTLAQAINLVNSATSDVAKFAVTQGGKLFATQASITGEINASLGKIGNIFCDSDGLYMISGNTTAFIKNIPLSLANISNVTGTIAISNAALLQAGVYNFKVNGSIARTLQGSMYVAGTSGTPSFYATTKLYLLVNGVQYLIKSSEAAMTPIGTYPGSVTFNYSGSVSVNSEINITLQNAASVNYVVECGHRVVNAGGTLNATTNTASGVPNTEYYNVVNTVAICNNGILVASSGKMFKAELTGSDLIISLMGLPTSSSGLASGRVWRNGTYLSVV